jgi:hypothetical protein
MNLKRNTPKIFLLIWDHQRYHARLALGSLIIKEKLGTSDRETVEQIKENPYLQYFIGQSHYSNIDTLYEPLKVELDGPPLGRPPANISRDLKLQALEDERVRNAIERKFGISKRRFSLNRVMAKLPHTSQTAIAIAVAKAVRTIS